MWSDIQKGWRSFSNTMSMRAEIKLGLKLQRGATGAGAGATWQKNAVNVLLAPTRTTRFGHQQFHLCSPFQ